MNDSDSLRRTAPDSDGPRGPGGIDWPRARPLLERLFELPEAERGPALERELVDEPDLARSLASLLDAGRRTTGMLEPPISPERRKKGPQG